MISRVSPAGDRLQGVPLVHEWRRLQAVCVGVDAVCADLSLCRRGQGVLATGTIRVALRLRCERCQGELPWQAELPVRTALAASEAAAATVDPAAEPVLAAGGVVDVQDWLEEEVLLSLPLLPRCEQWSGGRCPVSGVTVEPVEFKHEYLSGESRDGRSTE
ncbi:YceD family protein [Acidithiobacillus caldus]